MRLCSACLVSALCLLGTGSIGFAQCVSLTASGSPYSQDFDTLSNVGGSTTNTLSISGWFLTESGGGARDNEQYAVDTGASNTGDIYSYGAAGSSERALGTLRSGTLIPTIGACFTNNTGTTITTLAIAYTGEQWRLGTAGRTDQLGFEYSIDATNLATGTWTGIAALNFVTPDTATTGAKNGNAPGERTARSADVPSLSIPDSATFWIRWIDLDASGADDGLAVDEFSLTANSGPVVPSLGIADVRLAEGNPPGTTAFDFTVSLSSPAPTGGVTFDIATADGTAQDGDPATEDVDYVARSLTAQGIPAGSSTYTFTVVVNRDTRVEPDETFVVNLTNVTGANAGDVQAVGTILNDDIVAIPIHDIQGPGATSPLVGTVVSTTGIVTGVRSNGFFIQEPDASADADPATSEGILVFTGGAAPFGVSVGSLVQVTGTVSEFVPGSDPLQPPVTELTSPAVVALSTGHALPTPVVLTTTFPDPGGAHDQLERREGMRVAIASLTVVGPTLGTINDSSATATSSGVFHGVVTGVARPFREPGIPAPDPAPSGSGTIPPIPRFDANPERIRVDSDGLVSAPLIDVGAGAVVTGLVGPLDYGFRAYTILPDPGAPIAVSGGPVARAVSPEAVQEFTIGFFNLQRFYDTVNDPDTSDAVLTPAAFERRLAKASLAVRNFMRTPDVLAVAEMENLSTLQALAARISSDAVATSTPDPQYAAHLVEGNDVGGIDVGYLVKTAPVAGTTPHVTVNAVVQERAGTLFVNPDSSTEWLNDRPPLRLMATINHPNGSSFPVTVIANHLRSLTSVDSDAVGTNGWPTLGARVRAKRQKQAEDLASLVQERQAADPSERIILVGDFNAYEFNDGLVDPMNVIAGTPTPDEQTAVAGDGADLVNPDLLNLVATPAATERYGYVFDGNAQNLEHVLVNATLVADTVTRRIEHARIDADFPEVARNDATTPVRLSDHDPLVGYFSVAAFAPTEDDRDANGLPDDWEFQFGLGPSDGALDDPDNDGKTNIEEWREGTHPRGFHHLYFAEGATGSFFRTRFAVANPANPGPAVAHLLFRFLDSGGRTVTKTQQVEGRSRVTIDVATIPGMASSVFSTIVESDVPVVVDRTMTWDATGYGSHAETGIPAASTTWYLAEGATHSGFNLFYLLQNPTDVATDVTVKYLCPASLPPVIREYRVEPHSRFNIWVDTEGEALADTDVSAIIRSTQPIVVERAMYLDAPGEPFSAGHASAGVTAPNTSWYLAEGATGTFFDMFVLVENPTDTDAQVTATYLLPWGEPLAKSYTVPANSRFNVWVDREDERLADTAVSVVLQSTNGVPVVVERAMWWPGPTAAEWREAHSSAGSTVTGTSWMLAEGEEGGPDGFETYVLIANTSPFEGVANVTLLYEDGGVFAPAGVSAPAQLSLPPNSRTSVPIRQHFPMGAYCGLVFGEPCGRRFAIAVESVAPPGASAPAQIVVERAMYSNAGGVTWAAGTNALGARLKE